MKTLNALVDATLAIEKVRVASEVRQSHLKLQNKVDPETDELRRRLVDLENYVDGRIATHLKAHPAYPWFSRVKGIGLENIGKIIELVRIEPEYKDDGSELPYANTISALWKFAGYAPNEDGKAMKCKTGEKLPYNSQLRSMCWRVGGSLLRAKGKFYKYYLSQKEQYQARYEAQDIKIVPAAALPKINGKKNEGNEYISEGHIHNMALRKMIKLFLSCLWLKWREGEGLPVTNPYPIDKLGYKSFIDPWEMTDK
jgi:hypothetical protein